MALNIFKKFNFGLKKTRDNISGKIDEVISENEDITDQLYDDLEEILIMGDVGMNTSAEICEKLREYVSKHHLKKSSQVKGAIKEIVSEMLEGGEDMGLITMPSIILVIGVNGVGKTTTIGKMAAMYKAQGKKVILGAADTFRAAAIEQLEIWGERVGVPVIKQKMGSDPAAVAFDTVSSAKAQGADVVIIDTAGRLHNKVGLMNELTKVKNVMKRVVPDAPQEVLLVLDGSMGQNAFEQAKQFVAATEVNTLAITKLDGTSKGGVVIGISDQFKIPVKYIGLGEKVDDLQIFHPEEFVRSLFGSAI